MNDEKTFPIVLKDLEKAFDNIPTLETEQRVHEMVDAIKRLGETLRGCLELNVKVDDNAIKEITGGYGMTSTTLYLDEFIDIPRRKHKKKRIQKKWAKRYGYKTIIKPCVTIDNLQSVQTDNGYEFMGRYSNEQVH